MAIYYLPYPLTNKELIDALVKRGYIRDDGNQIGFSWTEKGRSTVDEFFQNLANLG